MTRAPTARVRVAYALFVLALGVATAGVGEGIVRLRGGRPWDARPAELLVEPGGRLYRADPVLGYASLPGRYRIRFPTGLAFTTTVDADGLRATRPPGEAPALDAPGLWIFGCSFTYGWAVDDDATYAWQLERLRPDLDVRNFAVSGYGTLQSLLQLERALRERPAPAVVVLAYASFHDERNTFTRRRRKRVAPFQRLGPLVQPFARLGRDGALEVEMARVAYRPWPGMTASALVHRLEQAWNELERRRVDSAAVTRAIVDRFVAEARASGARVVFATLTRNAHSEAMRAHAERAGATGLDLAIDLDAPGMRNLPHDGHPSPLAHARYARRLVRALPAAGTSGAPGAGDARPSRRPIATNTTATGRLSAVTIASE